MHTDEREESDYDLCLHRFQVFLSTCCINMQKGNNGCVDTKSGECVAIDASKMGNQARFTNDYR